MEDLENRILKGSRYEGMIGYWARYVDHILIVWSRTGRQIDRFPEETNAMHNDIKIDCGKSKNIYYLDLTLTMKSNRMNYKVYRKPTPTDIIF